MLSLYSAYKNKIANKLWGVVRLPRTGVKKGDVLISYLVDPFIQAPGEHLTDPHSSYWECFEIARLFSSRGYDVDIIRHNNITFIPKKTYATCVDIMQNLERLAPYLAQNCTKVLHIVSSYPEFQNTAEQKRIDDVRKRRGIEIRAKRTNSISRSPKLADFLEGFGNKTVHETYRQFNKPIFSIPISVAKTFDFPENKNFEVAKKHFLWFGGGGAIHKGLDLVVEAAAALPEFHLDIVGPAAYEEDFQNAYKKELSLPNISVYPRPRLNRQGEMVVEDKNILEIFNMCGAIIYPSCSEGTSGAVVQAMHAGLVPIITPQTGIKENDFARIISNPTVESIKNNMKEFAALETNAIRGLSKKTWQFARDTYTREKFSEAYAAFIDTVLLVD